MKWNWSAFYLQLKTMFSPTLWLSKLLASEAKINSFFLSLLLVMVFYPSNRKVTNMSRNLQWHIYINQQHTFKNNDVIVLKRKTSKGGLDKTNLALVTIAKGSRAELSKWLSLVTLVHYTLPFTVLFSARLDGVVVWMRMTPYRLIYLND